MQYTCLFEVWPSGLVSGIKGCPASPSAHQFAVWETQKTWVLAHCLCSLHLHIKGDKTVRRELQERGNYIVVFSKIFIQFLLTSSARARASIVSACNHEIGAICTRYGHNFRPSIIQNLIFIWMKGNETGDIKHRHFLPWAAIQNVSIEISPFFNFCSSLQDFAHLFQPELKILKIAKPEYTKPKEKTRKNAKTHLTARNTKRIRQALRGGTEVWKMAWRSRRGLTFGQ